MGMLKKYAMTKVKESVRDVLQTGEQWEVNSVKITERHSEGVDSCHVTPYHLQYLDGLL
jgi:hypothetical protein